jgi:hypothetical protein
MVDTRLALPYKGRTPTNGKDMRTKIKTLKTTYTNELEGYSLDLQIEVWEIATYPKWFIPSETLYYKVVMTNEGGGPLPPSCQSSEIRKTKREAVDHAIAIMAGCSNLYD